MRRLRTQRLAERPQVSGTSLEFNALIGFEGNKTEQTHLSGTLLLLPSATGFAATPGSSGSVLTSRLLVANTPVCQSRRQSRSHRSHLTVFLLPAGRRGGEGRAMKTRRSGRKPTIHSCFHMHDTCTCVDLANAAKAP